MHFFCNKAPCMMSKTRYLNDISFASDGAAVYRVSWQESTFYQLNDTRWKEQGIMFQNAENIRGGAVWSDKRK